MELEQTLRMAFDLRRPRADFEDVVMARLAAGAWRASQPGARKQRRVFLIGSLLAMSAAAALLVALTSGSSVAPEMSVVQQIERIVPPLSVATETRVSEQQTAALSSRTVPPAAPQAQDVSLACQIAAAEPPMPVSVTVLLMPLQSDASNPALQNYAQDYHNGVTRQLRSMQGIGLTTAETQIVDAKPADYRITATLLAAEDNPEPPRRAVPHMRLQLDIWNGTAFVPRAGTESEFSKGDENFICPFQARNCAANVSGATALMTLGHISLPRPATTAQAACQRERSESVRQQIAEQRRTDPSIDTVLLRNLIQNLATISSPTARSNMTHRRLDATRPEMREPLLAALRESTDDASRKEIVTLLAVKFAEDIAVQQALAAVATSSSDTLTHRIAQRALTGDDPWREFVITRLRDTSLPTTQRLEPLYWMADTMPANKQKLDAEISALLTELQRSDGIRVLADFVARTQQNPSDTTSSLLIQQGQRTMRQIASVNHPAVPELLIAYFDATPNYLTLGTLATRRDQPAILRKLETLAAGHPDPQIQRSADRYLREPLNPPQPAPPGN